VQGLKVDPSSLCQCNIPSPGKGIKMIKPVIHTQRLFFRYIDV
jgi:hypothetical protein